MLVVHGDAIKPDAPLIPTPATTAVEKLPDRTISADVRIISDLRLTNLLFAKEDYPAAHMTNKVEIAEGAVSSRRTWPQTEVVCCNRDFDDAFKRVRTHPDMCIILCAAFQINISSWKET